MSHTRATGTGNSSAPRPSSHLGIRRGRHLDLPRSLWHAHAPRWIFVPTIGLRRRAHILPRAVVFQVKQPRDERDGHRPCPSVTAPAVDVDHLARELAA